MPGLDVTTALDAFHPVTRTWFLDAFAAPTDVQARGWPLLRQGDNALLLAPTGSGKTLAAFLASLDRLAFDDDALDENRPKGIRVLYVSPLKALAVDIEKNLRAPLGGIEHTARRLGEPCWVPRVDVRTGDTTSQARQKQKRNPADILVTTPESLFLLLTSGAEENLKSVHTVILDEIHVLAGTKRGVHLALSLERLEAICDAPPQRIGLSATQRPLERIAHFLGGNRITADDGDDVKVEPRDVHIIDASAKPKLDLDLHCTVANMDRPPRPADIADWVALPTTTQRPRSAEERRKQKTRPGQTASRRESRVTGSTGMQGGGEGGIWPSVYPVLLQEIRQHTSTLIFVNSRLACERIVQKLNDLAGEEIVLAHHGSVSHEKRAVVEERLKEGSIPGIVATSSLELGIDMGAIDRVILVESPGAASTGLQRVGRAGHAVGETSQALMIPKFKGDLLESAVVAQQMLGASIEATSPPQNCLDVLAQQVAGMVAMRSMHVDEVYALCKQSAPFTTLTRPLLESVLDMLSGRFPSDAFAELPPRLNWDRTKDELVARRGTRMTAVFNAGTIPDRGLYRVHLVNGDGPRLGELDEEMVFETRQGDTIILGASTWRVEEIQQDKVLVSPAPGEPGRLPFWRGEFFTRPLEIGRAIGAFLSKVEAAESDVEVRALAQAQAPMNDYAVDNLVGYLHDQKDATGALPCADTVVVERFKDDLGDWRICILTPFGARLHAPWALAVEHLFAQRTGLEVKVMYSNDGIALQLTDAGEQDLSTEMLFPPADELEDILVEQLRHSALFAARFREAAGRALLLPKRSPRGRRPLWMQRKKSASLLASALQHPSFPVVLETYRECLQDVFAVPALVELLQKIERRDVRVVDVHTKRASPFARSLVYQYTATYLYDYDAPVAERRAAALSLDRGLLMELLGQESLRNLLDEEALREVESELQRLQPEFPPRDVDDVHDLLRQLGDLTTAELVDRGVGADVVDSWVKQLTKKKRAIVIRLQREERVIAVEDAARYRDAFGVMLPGGLPQVWLDKADDPVTSLLLRYARTHGPFTADDVAHRFGLTSAQVEALYAPHVDKGALELGEMRPSGDGDEYCDPDILRRIRRRTLAKLRHEVAPVDGDAYARFLLDWHGLHKPIAFEDALDQLYGSVLSFSVLVDEVLPSRARALVASELDARGATGELVWMGVSRLGKSDGKVVLAPRDEAALYLPSAEDDDDDDVDEERFLSKGLLDESALKPLAAALLQLLKDRGAMFFFELKAHLFDGDTADKLAETLGAPVVDADVEEALWELVWQGFITNDTFAPLRALRGQARTSARRRRGSPASNGRWSLTRPLRTGADLTRKRLAQAMQLLTTYGVVGRETVRAAGIPGGFAALYPVFRQMEDAGKVRRGSFIDGLAGAQFALPGVVDRLRASRDAGNEKDKAVTLAATDPANPYGATLPWPAHAQARPRRATGAKVVLVDGKLVFFLEKGKKSLLTFVGVDDERALHLASQSLRAAGDGRSLLLSRVDGDDAKDADIKDALLRAGFERDMQRLRLAPLL